MEELTPNQRLAILRALKQKVDAELKDVEGELKHNLLNAFDETGIDRMKIMVGGYDVGSATVVPSKMQPQMIPGREKEAIEFLQQLGLTETQPIKHWEDSFVNVGGQCVHKFSGAVCDAIEFTPAKAPYIRFTGFKPEKVAQAIQAEGISTQSVLGLMEGSNA